MNTPKENDDLITVQELARRLGWSEKTVRNKMAGNPFVRGVHYDSPPGMPTMFRWSAVLRLYSFRDAPPKDEEIPIPMARGYEMK